MLMKLNTKKAAQSVATAALLFGLALSASSVTPVAAQSDMAAVESVAFSSSAGAATPEAVEVQGALEGFIRGMSTGDRETVWAYASEEDQAAFETEQALFDAFAEDFPELTEATEVRIQNHRNEGDTPFVKLALRNADGSAYVAEIGFWLDDAGDWKVVSCDITPATDRIAAL